MTTLAPVSVALKFGFLAVLYLFVLWVARSARRDLRRGDATLRPSAASAAQRAAGRRDRPALGLGVAAPTSRIARRSWSSRARRGTSRG